MDCEEEERDQELIKNWRTYADWTRKAQIGNCRELSLVGLQFAVDRLKMRDIEFFEIIHGDHAFLVIGRDQDSDPKDFQNWGSCAVICDLWSETFFPPLLFFLI